MKAKQAQPWTQTEIPFPLEGIDLTRATIRQRPNTTIQAVNVRAFDMRTNRARGGSRPGFSKYFSTQLESGASIQNIDHLVSTISQSTAAVGQFVYAKTSGNGFGVGSSAGSSIFTAGNVSSYVFDISCWDQSGFVYVVERNTSNGAMSIYKYNAAGTQSWVNSSLTGGTGSSRRVVGAAVVGIYLAICVFNTAATTSSIHLINSSTGATVTSNWRTTSNTTSLLASTGAVNCMASIGNLLGIDTKNNVFLITDVTKPVVAANVISVSYALTGSSSARSKVVSDGNTFFYVIPATTTGSLKQISIGGQVGWTSTAAGTPRDMCYNNSDTNLYIAKSSAPSLLQVSITNGSIVTSGSPGSVTQWDCVGADNNGFITVWRNSNSSNDVMGTNTSFATVWGPSSFANVVHDGVTVNAQPFATPTNTAAPRVVTGMVNVNGALYSFTSTNGGTTTSTTTLIGSGWSRTAPVMYSAQLNQDMFFVDGSVYLYYQASTRSIQSWTASSGTEVPRDSSRKPAGLIARWNGRIVLAEFVADPQEIAMSAIGNAFDWNFARSPTTLTQAEIMSESDAGVPGDVVTCLVPYTNDVLVVGFANSIYQLNGDPAAGGSWSKVSPSIGMARGRPYAIDPAGQIYFWSNRGGIWKMTPGALPFRISQAIEQSVESVDLSANIIRMVWDVQAQGLAVYVSPIDSTQPATHFFYEERTNAWWSDQYTNTNHNPLAVHLFDGDNALDRNILLGTRDGYVQLVSNSYTTDDGDAISSSVLLGPLPPRYYDTILLNDLHAVLAMNAGTVQYDVYVGDSPEQALASSSVASGTWSVRSLTGTAYTTGRQHSTQIMRSGASIYVKLSSTDKWALESLRCRYRSMGDIWARL